MSNMVKYIDIVFEIITMPVINIKIDDSEE